MTKQNSLRHYLSKAKKANKRQDYNEMWKLYAKAVSTLDICYCFKCPQDDFGYCRLRRSCITDEERFVKYCFNGFIRDMEEQLKDLMKRKE